jgi:hypothetical protein
MQKRKQDGEFEVKCCRLFEYLLFVFMLFCSLLCFLEFIFWQRTLLSEIEGPIIDKICEEYFKRQLKGCIQI